MSYSNDVKNELARLEDLSPCCQLAELAGVVRMDGTILIGSGQKVSLELISENAAVARRVYTFFKDLFQVEATITVQRRTRLKKNNIYVIHVPSQGRVRSILDTLGMINQDGLMYTAKIAEEMIASDCCKRSYLRGVFLGSGSLTDPQRSYHLEIVTNSEEYAQSLIDLMGLFDLRAKMSYRKENIVVYLKESEQISDFLALIGAHEGLFTLENIRIQKEMRNQVNRLVNCETANLNKTVEAALRQCENIAFLEDVLGLDNLPNSLQTVAQARLAYPEVSLKELGELMDPPLGKSGINHRMRRLEELAEELRPAESG